MLVAGRRLRPPRLVTSLLWTNVVIGGMCRLLHSLGTSTVGSKRAQNQSQMYCISVAKVLDTSATH